MKIFNKICWFFLIFPLLFIGHPILAEELNSDIRVSYAAHVSGIGWMDSVKNGEVAGTTGQDKAIEAFTVQANLSEGSSIEYQSHISNIGWEDDWSSNGEESGTTGQALNLEAIRIQLTGLDAGNYDVYYRSHISDLGWLDWAKNGEDSGSTGLSRKLQAIQIVLVEKGADAPGPTTRPFVAKGMTPVNIAETHIQDIGWVESPFIDNMIGTTGEDKQIEAIKLTYSDEGKSGIEYRLHLKDIGWESQWHSNGELSGTVGENRQAEAIQIRLTGYGANLYDIYYQAHSADFGWLNWAKNGEIAGSISCGKKLEAVNITVVPKGSPAPGSTLEPYRQPIEESTFRARVHGAWIDTEATNVNSYVTGFTDYYMFTGFNQTFNGSEGYYEILSANTYGGKIRVVDQQTGQVIEFFVSFKDLPGNYLEITHNDETHKLILGDTTDGIHYSFSGIKQYGQLAVVELKNEPSS